LVPAHLLNPKSNTCTLFANSNPFNTISNPLLLILLQKLTQIFKWVSLSFYFSTIVLTPLSAREPSSMPYCPLKSRLIDFKFYNNPNPPVMNWTPWVVILVEFSTSEIEKLRSIDSRFTSPLKPLANAFRPELVISLQVPNSNVKCFKLGNSWSKELWYWRDRSLNSQHERTSMTNFSRNWNFLMASQRVLNSLSTTAAAAALNFKVFNCV